MDHGKRVGKFNQFSSAARLLSGMQSRVGAFLGSGSGGVSVEFVIILPVFLMLFVAMISVSMLLVTSSEVQQIAFEMTRGSLRYYSPGIDGVALCNDVQTVLAPSVMQTGISTQVERFGDIQCALDAAETAVTVTLTYDLSNHPAQWLAEMVGIDISSFTRSATMWL